MQRRLAPSARLWSRPFGGLGGSLLLVGGRLGSIARMRDMAANRRTFRAFSHARLMMRGLNCAFVDDRQRYVQHIRAGKLARRLSPTQRVQFAALQKLARLSPPVWRQMVALVVYLSYIFGILSWESRVPEWTPSLTELHLVLVWGNIPLMLAGLWLTHGPTRTAANSVASTCMGVCPACLKDLHGLEPEADGCTACPECGAAWKLDIVPCAETPAIA